MNRMLASRAFTPGPSPLYADGLPSLELYERAAALLPMGAWSCDLRDDRLTWTGGVFDLFGLSLDKVPERLAVVEMYDEESRELLERSRSHAIRTRSGFSLDASIIRADGAQRWIRITAATQHANGYAVALFGMKQDITEDRARWERLRARAECDPLTGIGNRAAFQRFLDGDESAPALDRVGALLLLDMDGFKQINDGWGHAAGDAALVALGERLRKAFPQAHLVCRIGGDEFAILLPPAISRDAAEADISARIGRLLAPVEWDGHALPISLSAGLAFVSEDVGPDPQELFVAADRALYSAKAGASAVRIRA
ncbi:MAG TPA: sensor domain-containing diguanylate cyclase [Novosphingobium sp.]